jgi:hypothetical protein
MHQSHVLMQRRLDTFKTVNNPVIHHIMTESRAIIQYKIMMPYQSLILILFVCCKIIFLCENKICISKFSINKVVET